MKRRGEGKSRDSDHGTSMKQNLAGRKSSSKSRTSDSLFADQSKWFVFKLLKVMVITAALVYIVIPVFVKTNPWIQNKIIFLNNLRWPPFIDFSDAEAIVHFPTRNFHLTTDDEIRLGLWHVLPGSLKEADISFDKYEALLNDSHPVVLYLHGNSGTRAGWHRVGLYRVLAEMNFHVIAMDYRGYGDSSGSPSEDGVVSDALFVYRWLRQRKGNAPFFIWGHSLGTGVTAKLAKIICRNDEAPDGIFLESGFNNILDAATHHPMASPYKKMPWFHWLFLDTITENNIHFQSDQSIADVSPPLLILHAEDDVIVPFHLGVKLYEAAVSTRPDMYGPAEFVPFNASLGYGHKLIFMAPELPDIIRKFMQLCQERKQKLLSESKLVT
ncbi:lysophosphatidylserine lipase ABHD12-like [Mya arenaria]|uniref:lysophosphatidylserine lipase ABHD12-like n=1 Tax=Mya arenaria TaxID=6604 RepID=UPI0022E5B91F|nr:lysophosphatidylserine lipase ABHD12-like [Mya arenaria]